MTLATPHVSPLPKEPMTNAEPIYLDHNATTPLKPTARTAMLQVLDRVGNASSIHSFGRAMRKIVEDARAHVAALVNAAPKQVIFNSGATEGNNTILRGFAGTRLLVGATEHPSVLECAATLNAEKIPVHPNGLIDLDALQSQLTSSPPVGLISVMLVNNETGVIQPVADIAALARAHGAALHCDAVQAAGKIDIDMAKLSVDFLTLSAHKVGGPQGVGALIIADGATVCRPVPVLLLGGGQERRTRAGTENVSGIAGFGAAALAARADRAAYQSLALLRDRLERTLRDIHPHTRIFGHDAPRVAGTISFAVPGTSAETLLMKLDLAGIALSSGSACSSGTVKPSHVLASMRATDDEQRAALRLSMGWSTTPADIDRFIAVWHDIVKPH